MIAYGAIKWKNHDDAREACSSFSFILNSAHHDKTSGKLGFFRILSAKWPLHLKSERDGSWTVLVPFSMLSQDPIRSASTHDSTILLHLPRNILLENLSPVNQCDCAVPIRSPRSWANRSFKSGGSSCKRSSVSCPNFRAASLRKIVSKLFCRTGTLATQGKTEPISCLKDLA